MLVAMARHERSFLIRGSEDSVNPKSRKRDLEVHLMGARAELAWCVLDGVEWSGSIDNFDRPDVEPDIEIRCRDRRWSKLIIRDRDLKGEKPGRRFVAAKELEDGRVEFDGWCFGWEASRFKKTDPGNFGRPARFIPVEYLHRLPFYRESPRRHKQKEAT